MTDADVCLKENPTVLQMMKRIEELEKENIELKYDNEVLHNKLQDKIEIENMKKEYEKKGKEYYSEYNDLESCYGIYGYDRAECNENFSI